jgi:xanthine dehydrogenase accessory factor
MSADTLEPTAINADLLQLEQRLIEAGKPFAVVTVIRAAPPTSTRVGAQALVESDGALHGWIGGGCSQSIVIEAARQSIRSGQPKRVRISNEPSAPDAEVEAHAMPCTSNGTLELFIQPTVPAPLVVVFGTTPAALEACVLARRVGLRACMATDAGGAGVSRFDADALSRMNPALMLIATQGDGDEDALEAALRSSALAVLLIASRRKAERLRETMRLRGIGDARLAALHAPAGPAIHAHTPQEIALGAVAGLVTLRHELEAAAERDAAALEPAAVTTEAVPPLPPCEALGAAATTGGSYVNPVCGMKIDIASAKYVVEYGGQRVYFCCDCCKAEFERAPERYLAPASKPGAGDVAMGTVTFSAVMLAAGLSLRMEGLHKLLLPVHGEPAVRRVARAVLAARPQEVVVVTGFNGRAVFDALEGLDVRFQSNPRYREGQMTSVAAGVAALQAPCDAVMVCLADQVLLDAADYRELIDAYAAMPRGSILVPMFKGARGNPVVFASSYAPEVVNGHVNPGCRKLIAERGDEVFIHEATHDRFNVDMDTPADYMRVVARVDAASRAASRE